ncbi:hypothetical protein IWQ62_000026 [Dispira parvispora]|uniref:BHLH domain-containing protein n=1 Tax=Dispira parvispora TaxID=1520584 RepID=A0A9W8B294_9FUNG|nr:hypothetical protein IWQ62_000026 [Dispira parvispora]
MHCSPQSISSVIHTSEPLECILSPSPGSTGLSILTTEGKRGQTKKRSSSADRRANHNRTERTRRELLNRDFQILAKEVPKLTSIRRPSKSQVVQAACHYLKKLKKRNESQSQEIRKLEEEASDLYSQLNELRKELGMGELKPPTRKPQETSWSSSSSESSDLLLSPDDIPAKPARSQSPAISEIDGDQSILATGVSDEDSTTPLQPDALTIGSDHLLKTVLGWQTDPLTPHSPMGFPVGVPMSSPEEITMDPQAPFGVPATHHSTPLNPWSIPLSSATSLSLPTTQLTLSMDTHGTTILSPPIQSPVDFSGYPLMRNESLSSSLPSRDRQAATPYPHPFSLYH